MTTVFRDYHVALDLRCASKVESSLANVLQPLFYYKEAAAQLDCFLSLKTLLRAKRFGMLEIHL